MATTTSITTTYAGQYAGQIIGQSLLAGNTLANGLVTFKPNIIGSEVVRRLETGTLIADGTCDFSDTSTVTSTERILTPKELQVNLELCKKDWLNDWSGVQMGASAHRNMPSDVQSYIIQRITAKVSAENEVKIWQGAAGAGSYDGFETLLAADAALPAAQEVTGTTVTAANVIDELGKVVDAIPSSLYGRDDLYIYVSQNIYRKYKRALGGFGTSGLGAAGYLDRGNNQDIPVEFFDGVKVAMVNGMSDDVMIAGTADNFWFGTSILSDWNEVKLLDMADLDGSQNFRYIQRFLAGVQYGVVEDIVTYGIVNSAN